MTIKEFCRRHKACRGGREWAIAHCETMDDVWMTAPPEWLVWVATRPGVLPDRDLRLFACWCVRQVWGLLDDARSRHAVEVAERFADGGASDEELAAESAASRDAASDAESAASRDAARAAARAAESAASRDAARAAARAAACAADAARAADASYAAEAAVQAEYLRERFSPFVEMTQ